jgi:hypothetical protein
MGSDRPPPNGGFSLLFFFCFEFGMGVGAGLSVSARERAAAGGQSGRTDCSVR